jgi:hypothetical protein
MEEEPRAERATADTTAGAEEDEGEKMDSRAEGSRVIFSKSRSLIRPWLSFRSLASVRSSCLSAFVVDCSALLCPRLAPRHPPNKPDAQGSTTPPEVPEPTRAILPPMVVTAALLTLVGLAGQLLGASGPLALAWLALWALPAGVLSARLGRPAGLIPALWAAVLLGTGAGWPPAAVCGGFFAAGLALGRAGGLDQGVIPRAGLSLLLLAVASGAPAVGGLAGDAPWSPRVSARLLDLSPVVLVVESAGVDWTRHPAVYDPAGGDALGPDLRQPWRGELAGPGVLLVGCTLLLVALRRRVAPTP